MYPLQEEGHDIFKNKTIVVYIEKIRNKSICYYFRSVYHPSLTHRFPANRCDHYLVNRQIFRSVSIHLSFRFFFQSIVGHISIRLLDVD